MKDWVYRHIGGPLGYADYRYLVFIVLMTELSTMAWVVGSGVL
jgi:hypothetical protein